MTQQSLVVSLISTILAAKKGKNMSYEVWTLLLLMCKCVREWFEQCFSTYKCSFSYTCTIYCFLSYLGGLRLLQATCKKFYQYCAQHGSVMTHTHTHTICISCSLHRIALGRRNFSLQYDTNIPRQVVCQSYYVYTCCMWCVCVVCMNACRALLHYDGSL